MPFSKFLVDGLQFAAGNGFLVVAAKPIVDNLPPLVLQLVAERREPCPVDDAARRAGKQEADTDARNSVWRSGANYRWGKRLGDDLDRQDGALELAELTAWKHLQTFNRSDEGVESCRPEGVAVGEDV